ncbi:MAG: Chaperonin 10 Kd subunit [Bacteroidota bacterium]|jgi:co-chaperonin GroES (HSP10)
MISPIVEAEKSKSGLLLSGTDSTNMRYQKAKVVNVGTDVPTLKSEDVIYYDKANGHDIRIDEIVYRIILERDVVVVL